MPVRRVSRAVATLVTTFLVASGLLVVQTSGSAVALPGTPTNLQSSADDIPRLSWDPVSGATRYQVQGSENIGFTGTKVFDVNTVNTNYVPVRVLKEGLLYWRVQAVDGTGAGPFSTIAEATIATHVPPTGLTVAPPSGTTILPPVSPPVVTWNAVPGAIGYDLELDNEGDGVGGVVTSNIKTTTYVIPDPQGVGETTGFADFFVRVRAKFPNSLQTDWTPYSSYNVSQLDAVTSATCGAGLVCAPTPGGGVRARATVQDVVFDWDPVAGAKQYEIWVALNSDFTNEVERRVVYSTRYSPKTTYDNNTYYWKVRPINAANQPAPWPPTPSDFERRWPDRPSLVWPPNTTASTVGDDFYYQWTPVQHAGLYRLEVSSDPNFAPPLTNICTTAQTTYAAGYKANDPCMPFQGVTTYWRVRAFDQPLGVEGIYSDADPDLLGTQPGKFVYSSGVVARQSPTNGASVSVPTLRWAPSREAQKYDVVVYYPNGDEADSATTSALSWTPTEELLPEDGPYRWTVTAVDGDNHHSPTPALWTFNVVAPPTTSAAPDPLPGVFEPVLFRFPQLAWEPVTDAYYYKLRVSDTPGFVLPENATDVLGTELHSASVTDWGTFFLRPGTTPGGSTPTTTRTTSSPPVRSRRSRSPSPAPSLASSWRSTAGPSTWAPRARPPWWWGPRDCVTTSPPPRSSTGHRSPEPAATSSTSPRTPTSPTG